MSNNDINYQALKICPEICGGLMVTLFFNHSHLFHLWLATLVFVYSLVTIEWTHNMFF